MARFRQPSRTVKRPDVGESMGRCLRGTHSDAPSVSPCATTGPWDMVSATVEWLLAHPEAGACGGLSGGGVMPTVARGSRRMRSEAGWVCLAALAWLPVLGCGTSDDNGGIGRAVAGDLDSLNGLPILVLEGYWPFGVDSLAPDDRPTAAAIASGFAEERGIPIEQGNPTSTCCSWSPAPGDQPLGLWAHFGKPQEFGDSTVIYLATGCMSLTRPYPQPNLFEQVHIYTLRRTESSTWEVVRRRLGAIT